MMRMCVEKSAPISGEVSEEASLPQRTKPGS